MSLKLEKGLSVKFSNSLDVQYSIQAKKYEVLKTLVPKILAIIEGERDLHLAEDPSLSFDASAELLFLFEKLQD